MEGENIKDVIVVGGGASGLLTAALCAKKGLSVLLLERNNKVGKKLYATGNGRCNYLNKRFKNSDEIFNVLWGFGIYGSEEDEGRFYPRSREASSVVSLLEDGVLKNGGKIECDFHVTEIKKSENGFKLMSKDGRTRNSEKLVIATAGKAGIQYGCYGEGYRWAQIFGHSLVKPIPALVPMECEEDITLLHGVRVNAMVSLLKNNELIAMDKGELQFTKDAVSGICVMNLSGKLRLSDKDKYILSVDLFPEYDTEKLKAVLEEQKKYKEKMLFGLLPEKLNEYILLRSKNEDDILKNLKSLKFSIKGTKGWDLAQVTAGGIPFNELSENYESKFTQGLFFTGEIVDYDGVCGGYNLSHAFYSAIKASEVM